MKKLSDRAKELVSKRAYKSWVDRVPQDRKEELEELRRDYQTGRIPHVSVADIYHQLIVVEFGSEVCSESTFRSWIRRNDSQKNQSESSRSKSSK